MLNAQSLASAAATGVAVTRKRDMTPTPENANAGDEAALARIAELRSEITPADIVNVEYLHAKLLSIAAQVPQAAGNRDLLSRIAENLRHIARAFDHQAGAPAAGEVSAANVKAFNKLSAIAGLLATNWRAKA